MVSAAFAVFGVHVPGISGRASALESVEVAPNALATKDSLVLGPPSAKVRLVMFGDYQCPPCRAEWPRIEALAKAHPGALAVYFRNFPLIRIHPWAFPAAVVAEEARRTGHFAAVHDRLYRNVLNDPVLKACRSAAGIDAAKDAALQRGCGDAVFADLGLARSLGLAGTPTLFVVDRDDHVFRLDGPEAVRPFVD